MKKTRKAWAVIDEDSRFKLQEYQAGVGLYYTPAFFLFPYKQDATDAAEGALIVKCEITYEI